MHERTAPRMTSYQAYQGPAAAIGLVAPHLARRASGPDEDPEETNFLHLHKPCSNVRIVQNKLVRQIHTKRVRRDTWVGSELKKADETLCS